MNVVRSAEELRIEVAAARSARGRVAFVPTMGALHEGHLSLLRAARNRADLVVLSIFVNPLQFGPEEDFDAYPRDEARDLELARAEGCDVVFLPPVESVHPPGRVTSVHVAGPLTETLEGESRPGHFDGVATVVAALFNLVMPDLAIFGQKDAQQVAVVRRMTEDLAWPIEIVVCPTVRADDGLALSSRNRYLSPKERDQAVAVVSALRAGEAALRAGGTIAEAEVAMADRLAAAPEVVCDYARAVDAETFEAPTAGRPVLLAIAATVGRARLIDNVVVQ